MAPGADASLEPDLLIKVYKKDIDWTLIRENLKLTPEQRLLQLMKLQESAEELRAATGARRTTSRGSLTASLAIIRTCDEPHPACA